MTEEAGGPPKVFEILIPRKKWFYRQLFPLPNIFSNFPRNLGKNILD
jgi:hypothetical protein